MNIKFNLAKLTVSAYNDRTRVGDAVQTVQAMFNPESISQTMTVNYTEAQGIGAPTKQLNYACSPPTEMRMTLVYDQSLNRTAFAWAQAKIARRAAASVSVSAQVQAFLTAAYDVDGAIHQPRWLKLQWGDRSYHCRLVSVEAKYTGFDRSGMPIAAELDILLREDVPDVAAARANNFQSPDVTHLRIVKVGDTLPLLSAQVYGDPSYYALVAQANDLDDFRNLQPGLSLYFPPLT